MLTPKRIKTSSQQPIAAAELECFRRPQVSLTALFRSWISLSKARCWPQTIQRRVIRTGSQSSAGYADQANYCWAIESIP